VQDLQNRRASEYFEAPMIDPNLQRVKDFQNRRAAGRFKALEQASMLPPTPGAQ
jgi:hypothetical protein